MTYDDDSSMSTIDLEYGITSNTTTRAEHTTTGRKNLVKAIMGVAGIAAVGAIGAVTTVVQKTETGYGHAMSARRLDAAAPAATAPEPTATDSISIVSGMAQPAYLRVPGFKKCLVEEVDGAVTRWCVPKIKPSACIDKSWGAISSADADMGVAACAEEEVEDVNGEGQEVSDGADEHDDQDEQGDQHDKTPLTTLPIKMLPANLVANLVANLMA